MVMLPAKLDELDYKESEESITPAVHVPNISWTTYKLMLQEMGDHRAARVAYNQGTLTIKMPSKLHELVNSLLARIVLTLTEELELEVVNVGSTTLERSDLEKGAEPDTGLYVQNAEYIEGLEPDLPPNLPPDLVIEVDIASPSTKRMAIYQALGVPEVWRYTKRLGVVIYHLEANVYIESSNSKAIPQLSADKLNEFIAQRQTQTDNQTIRAVRHWIQSLE